MCYFWLRIVGHLISPVCTGKDVISLSLSLSAADDGIKMASELEIGARGLANPWHTCSASATKQQKEDFARMHCFIA